MQANHESLHFLKRTILYVILGALLAILLVVMVDPYRIYGVLDQAGFNQVKPVPDRYQEQIKLLGAKRINANALILGNSRAEIGFNPEDKVFSEKGYVAYNLAIAGSGIDTSRRELEYLRLSNRDPAVIILGLDFLDFLIDPNASASNPEIKKMSGFDGLKWQFDAIFSLRSVTDSLKTLQIQHKTEVETVTAKGFNPLLEYNKYARDQGYYALFQQRAEENAKNYLRKSAYLVAPATGDSLQWRELRSILNIAAEQDADLHLVIYPYHAQILFMFEQVGLMPKFEQWKEQLTIELDQMKVKRSTAKHNLWDFSGYSAIQCEAIPSKGDKLTKTNWYWEAGHFKDALGSVILSKIVYGSQADLKGGFGYALNFSNLGVNRQRLQNERQECINRYTELASDVARLIKEKR